MRRLVRSIKKTALEPVLKVQYDCPRNNTRRARVNEFDLVSAAPRRAAIRAMTPSKPECFPRPPTGLCPPPPGWGESASKTFLCTHRATETHGARTYSPAQAAFWSQGMRGRAQLDAELGRVGKPKVSVVVLGFELANVLCEIGSLKKKRDFAKQISWDSFWLRLVLKALPVRPAAWVN